jgi:type I restriction enzyme, S subunit
MVRTDDFPSHWPQLPLGRVARFLDHMRRPVTASDRNPGPFPYYGANGQQGTIDGFIFDEPLVLLAEDGGNFGDASRPISYEIRGKTWVNNHAHVLRPNSGLITPSFLNRVLAFYDVRAFISGTTRAKLTKGEAERIPIPVPTPCEQRRIVELLEQADALRRQRAETDALASRILPALFRKFFGDLARNSKSWHCDALGNIIADTRNGLYKHADFYGRGTQILKMFNILEGRLNLKRVDRVEVTADEFAIYRLEPGDILVNRVNTPELVGKCAVIQSGLGDAVFESKNIRVRLKVELAHPEYIAHFLNTSFGHATLCQGVKHAIGMATINNSDLRNCRIPLPPVELQTDWAKHVAAARKIATRAEASGKNLERLFQVLLHRAFTGELTARWREAHMKDLLAEMEQQARHLNNNGATP